MASALNKAIIGFGVVTIGVLIYRISSSESTPDYNQQKDQARHEFHMQNTSEEDVSLNNTKSTLNTLLAEKKKSEAKVEKLDNQVDFLTKKLESLTRSANQSNTNDIPQHVRDEIALLKHGLDTVSAELKEQKQINRNLQSSSGSITGDGDLRPIGVTDYENTSEEDPYIVDPVDSPNSSLVDYMVQPAIDQVIGLGLGGDGGDDGNVLPIGHEPTQTGGDVYVWVQQDDMQTITDKEGNQTQVYAVNVVNGGKPIDPLVRNGANENNSINGDFGFDQGQAEADKKAEPVPIYTVPQNSTLFGSVGLSAILGRVPIGNELTNPFRFKVKVGPDNLASNQFFMPHLKEMVVSGFAEGDFTLECARGTIDKVTFTFNDMTVREIKSENSNDPLGWISDEYGVPCISGQYLTNFPEYMTKQAGLTALASFAGAIKDSAVTTSTSAEGVTTTVVNDSIKAAAADGFQDGSAEITKWYAERQTSAFDVVYVRTGEKVVINIEKALHVDYEPDGRKLIHKNNSKEYLGW